MLVNLESLDCSECKIKDVSKLINLECIECHMTEIDDVSMLPKLKKLVCDIINFDISKLSHVQSIVSYYNINFM